MSLKIVLFVALLPLVAFGAHNRCEVKCKGRCVVTEDECDVTGGTEKIYTGQACTCHGSDHGDICCVSIGQCDMEPVCEDSCHSKWNSVCDDGGEGSMTSNCQYKTDCHDCGARKDKCELIYGGVCRSSCMEHEYNRTEDDLCTSSAGCICCVPKCDYQEPSRRGKTKCERNGQGHCVTHPIDCENFHVNEHAYNGSLADCNGDPQGRGVCCTDMDEGMEGLCDDTCESSGNGLCEDGGPDSVADTCVYGTDYTDCGTREEYCKIYHKGICRRGANGCARNEIEIQPPPGVALGLCRGKAVGNPHCICCKPICTPPGDGTANPNHTPNPNTTNSTPAVRMDPKYVTIDGNVFHYEGRCAYTLLRECENPTQHPWFVVYVEHTSGQVYNSHGQLQAYVKGAIIEVDTGKGTKHTIHFTGHGQVKINNDPAVDMAAFRGWEDRSLGLTVNTVKQRLSLTLDGYFTVSYNRKESVFVELDKSMTGRVCGLMGDGDGNPFNDFIMLDPNTPGGLKVLQTPNKAQIDAFGDSWVKPGSCPE